jgi:hypothetical protein
MEAVTALVALSAIYQMLPTTDAGRANQIGMTHYLELRSESFSQCLKWKRDVRTRRGGLRRFRCQTATPQLQALRRTRRRMSSSRHHLFLSHLSLNFYNIFSTAFRILIHRHGFILGFRYVHGLVTGDSSITSIRRSPCMKVMYFHV